MVSSHQTSHTENSAPRHRNCSTETARYRQALHIGYVEMERIIEEIVSSELTRVGEFLLAEGFKVELVICDTESELDGKLYLCGAGLHITRGFMENAVVFTGDPSTFTFVLQTQNYASRTTEETVEYHKLTPAWIHKRLRHFLKNYLQEIDLNLIEEHFKNDWDQLEGPFSIKVKNDYGYYNEIATAETLERAFQISSFAAQTHYHEDDLIVVDKHGHQA